MSSPGNDDVFALNAKTGEFLWERWSGIDQKITSVCCGLGQSRAGDGRRNAFPRSARRQRRGARHQTGKEMWKTPIEVWQDRPMGSPARRFTMMALFIADYRR